MTELHTIRTAGKKEVPDGTKMLLRASRIPGHIEVQLQFPGQKKFSNLGSLPIKNGTVTLPLKLVFLCHARDDREAVRQIGDCLWQDGFIIWLDERDILPGDKWKDRIEDAIERSDFVLVFLSSRSISKTGYVQHEINYALEQYRMRPLNQRYIIPILLEPCEPPRQFNDIQWVEIWQSNAYDMLKKAMK